MTQSPVCIRCGEQYLFTRTYKDNYYRGCHGSWIAKPWSEEAPRPRPQRSRTTSLVHHREDDKQLPGPESSYDEV